LKRNAYEVKNWEYRLRGTGDQRRGKSFEGITNGGKGGVSLKEPKNKRKARLEKSAEGGKGFTWKLPEKEGN